MNFEEWWTRVGRWLDAEPCVHWYEKRKDLMAVVWAAAKAQSGNYTCDTVVRPSKVTFANGRWVEIVGNEAGTFLEIGRDD